MLGLTVFCIATLINLVKYNTMKKRIVFLLFTLMSLSLFSQNFQLNGNLGLGTVPDAKLDVDGDSRMRGDTEVEGQFRLQNLASNLDLLDQILIVDDSGYVQRVMQADFLDAIFQNNCENYWYTDGDQVYLCDPDVKVGIGHDNPQYTLDVIGQSHFSNDVTIEQNLSLNAQNEGDYAYSFLINSGNDNSKAIAVNQGGHEGFMVNGDGSVQLKDGGSDAPLRIVDGSENNQFVFQDGRFWSRLSPNATNAISIWEPGGAHEIFKVEENGDVYATKITVQMLPFPDYVFDPEYKLMSLADLEKYIQEHQSLPNMPSAREVESSGANLGELNRLLVEKVEELTLYIIDINKALEVLKAAEQK